MCKFCALVLTFFCLSFARGSAMEWVESVEQVKKGPYVLVFVGEGWCPWSDLFLKEVLLRPQFKEAYQEEMSFVKVSFAERREASAPSSLELREKYHVEELPSLVLVDAFGEEVTKMGYLPLPAERLAASVQNAFAHYKEIKAAEQKGFIHLPSTELKQLYHKAQGLKSKAWIQELLQTGLKVDRGTFFLMEQYLALLPKGKKGREELQQIKRKIF